MTGYHCCMRVLLIAFMIALLPVRAWLGDAMAVSMVAWSDQAVVNAAAQLSNNTASTAVPPCHGSGDAHGPAAFSGQLGAHHADEHLAEPGEAPLCHTLCDVCNGPAMAHVAPSASILEALPHWTAPSPERFASHHVRRDVRPPIA